MIGTDEQKIITGMVVEFIEGGKENIELYNAIYNRVEKEVQNRAKNFIKSNNKESLLVDLDEYRSVALYDGFHKAINSYDINKNKNFIPYMYTCVDNALKSQVGKDKADKRIVNEQAITYTALASKMEEQGAGLDYLDCFKDNVSTEDRVLKDNRLAMIFKEYGEIHGADKLQVLLAYELSGQLERTVRINEIYGEPDSTTLSPKIKKRVERIKKQVRESRHKY